MTITQKITRLVPFIILFALLALLARELFYAKPNELPSTLIDESVPAFRLPNLLQPRQPFTEKALLGRVVLLNVWATWCYACNIEHPMLMSIKNNYHIPIYSIIYKDNPTAAKKMVTKKW